MPTSPRTMDTRQHSQSTQSHRRRPQLLCVALLTLSLLAVTISTCHAAPINEVDLFRRQEGVLLPSPSPSSPSSSVVPSTTTTHTTSVTATAAPTVTSAPISTTVTSTTVASTTATHTTATRTITTTSTTTSLSGTLTLTTTTSTTSATATNGDTTGDPTSSKGLVVGGAVIGGLVFVIGAAIVAFRCTLNRRDRQRRNKEMAATLAENFDRSADPIGTPRKGYLELSDGPPTPASGHVGANLSRQGSQDAYFGAHKEGSVVGGGAQNEYYNPHYIQERYGTAHASNYGMYEETELSVINGNGGRPTTPYDHSMAYPPASVPSSHYAGYNDYGGHHDGGYYGGGGGGGGQPPRGPQGY